MNSALILETFELFIKAQFGAIRSSFFSQPWHIDEPDWSNSCGLTAGAMHVGVIYGVARLDQLWSSTSE